MADDLELDVDVPRSPLGQLEHMDDAVELAALDEMKTCFDPDTHPKDHDVGGLDEPTTDANGTPIDVQLDTPDVDNAIMLDLPSLDNGLF